MNTYHLGTGVRLTGIFTDVAGAVADPTAISLVVRDPSGNEATYTFALGTITRTGVGVYYQDVTCDERGVWYYEWQGTGAVVATTEEAFYCAEGEV